MPVVGAELIVRVLQAPVGDEEVAVLSKSNLLQGCHAHGRVVDDLPVGVGKDAVMAVFDRACVVILVVTTGQ
jgi:hypothetical protein